jgi:hypothetical protein
MGGCGIDSFGSGYGPVVENFFTSRATLLHGVTYKYK